MLIRLLPPCAPGLLSPINESRLASPRPMGSSFPAAPDLNDISISDTAERAHQLLLCCQEIHEEKPKRIAAAQLSRFNLWTSNIGVFSSRHASLDYRLRTAPTAKAAVDGNLEILCKHLLSGEISYPVAEEGGLSMLTTPTSSYRTP